MTKIEWATEVWNPITGCTPVSEGCANCYARRMAQRLKGRFGYPEDEPFRVTFHPDRLYQPLKWRKPRRIFVCSMGDLFHESVTEGQWVTIFDTIRKSIYNGGGVGHKFLILTKRPHIMKLVMERLNWNGFRLTFNKGTPFISLCGDGVWLGVTAENQQTADERIPILLQISAAKYFVSHEPGLGLINYPKEFLALGNRAWLITGGESGSGARPMHPDIPRHDRDQCQEAGVPFFFKQWGEYVPDIQYWQGRGILNPSVSNSKIISGEEPCFSLKKPGFNYLRIGKKAAGRLIDDRQWNERP